jgi:hypothetical protein
LDKTLAIFLLNNGKEYTFCIPIQYVGDYKIEKFEFKSGNILIGDYDILLNRDELNIYVYLDEEADVFGDSDGDFTLIYSEENGRVLISKMGEPLATKHESDETMNHYYIFIEKHLKNDDVKRITNEYERGNVYSKLSIWYDMTVDNELQAGNGMLDDFELHDGQAIDPAWFPANLDFFKAKYM